MQIMTAEFEIVTPMFIGDANKEATGISPQSVKGALRFWWRALNWGKVLKEVNNDEVAALQRLHCREVELFGGLPQTVDGEQIGGQGMFIIRVLTSEKMDTQDNWPSARSLSGYLGIGLWESGSTEKGNYQPHRESFVEDQNFTVKLLLKPSITDEQKQDLSDVLMLWGLVGALGSRVRRGFGSIALTKLDDIPISFSHINDYWDKVTKLLVSYPMSATKPPFSAFSQQVMLGLANPAANARDAHKNLGLLFNNYRGQPSSLRGTKKAVFGLPYSGGTLEQSNARRASPLLFHVHTIGAKYQGVVLYLPATFHHKSTLAKVDETLLSGFFNQLKVIK